MGRGTLDRRRMIIGEHNFIEVRAFHGWPEGAKNSTVLVREFSCEVSAVQQARGLQGDTWFFFGTVCRQSIAEFFQGFAYQLLEAVQLFRGKALLPTANRIECGVARLGTKRSVRLAHGTIGHTPDQFVVEGMVDKTADLT